MQQIKILFSTDELSIKFKPLNCYGACRLRGLRGRDLSPYEHRTLYEMRKHCVYTGGMFDIIKANLIKRKTMKKIVLAAVVAGLCSLNLAGADEDIAKFEAGCNAGIAQDCTRAGAYYSDKSSRSKNTDKQAREISVKFLEKACELKDGNGCLILGSTYIVIFEDNEKAKFYTEKSCDMDYGEGCEALGLRYENGTYGFAIDKKKAKYFYNKACKLGAKWSCKYAQAL